MMAPAPKKLNVIEMERVSTDKQDLARQKYDLEANREKFGLNVLYKISLKLSGTEVADNDEVKEMTEAMTRPGVDGLSVSSLDRLMRPKDFDIALLQVFHKHRKVIVSKREGYIEPWMPQGWATIMRAIQQAGQERFDLLERSSSGRHRAHKEKKPCNTTACYGVVYVDKYSRDAEGHCQYFKEDVTPSSIGTTRREVVEMVFHWRVDLGWRIGTIQAELNRRGILTAGRIGKGGTIEPPGAWSRQTVRQLLLNKHYIGEHWEGGKMIDCVRYEPFVSRQSFAGAEKMFESEKQNSNGTPPTQHLLCSFLRCRYCRRRYRTATGGGGRHPVYVCGNYDYRRRKQICRANSQVQCRKIDPIVWRVIWSFLTSPELLMANAKAYYDALPSKTGTAKLEKELAEISAQMERTQNMVRTGRMNEDKGNDLIDQDLARIDQIKRSLHDAGSVMTLPSAFIVKAACERIAKSGAKLETFEERRPVLEKLVDLTFTFDRGEVEIEGKVPVAIPAQKCNSRIDGHYSSVQYIPFKIKERVA